MIINKGGLHEEYFRHLLRYLLFGKNSIFEWFIAQTKHYCEIGTEIASVNLIRNLIKKYNNVVMGK